MAFGTFVTSKAGLLQAKSSKILSSFVKTREELVKLNQSLDEGITEHSTTLQSIKTEIEQMNTLKAQHSKVITNIDTFLSV